MLKKILVSVDGSELAERAIPYAKSLAEQYGAELLVIRVAHPLPIISDFSTASYEAIVAAEHQATENYLVDLNDRFSNSPVAAKMIPLHEQDVAEAIIDYACREQVDLIVMSTHGRSGFSRWIHGSVATKVLNHAPCPVFLVRATEAKTNGAH